jgi:hypothetical protein
MATFLTDTPDVPRSLRAWFVVHFVADIAFAVPLLLMPEAFGAALGYDGVDPLTARLVGAALVGIGVESLLGRNATRASFVTMLRLKVLWSSTATIGTAATVATTGGSLVAWFVLGTFAVFCAVWTCYFLLLRRG